MKMIKVVSRIERISLQNNIFKRKLYAIKISRKLVKKHIIAKTRNEEVAGSRPTFRLFAGPWRINLPRNCARLFANRVTEHQILFPPFTRYFTDKSLGKISGGEFAAEFAPNSKDASSTKLPNRRRYFAMNSRCFVVVIRRRPL